MLKLKPLNGTAEFIYIRISAIVAVTENGDHSFVWTGGGDNDFFVVIGTAAEIIKAAGFEVTEVA